MHKFHFPIFDFLLYVYDTEGDVVVSTCLSEKIGPRQRFPAAFQIWVMQIINNKLLQMIWVCNDHVICDS